MFAAVVTLSIDPAQAPAAAAAFTSEILPKVRSAPGLVAGYWLDPEEGRGFGFLLFDTETTGVLSDKAMRRSTLRCVGVS